MRLFPRRCATRAFGTTIEKRFSITTMDSPPRFLIREKRFPGSKEEYRREEEMGRKNEKDRQCQRRNSNVRAATSRKARALCQDMRQGYKVAEHDETLKDFPQPETSMPGRVIEPVPRSAHTARGQGRGLFPSCSASPGRAYRKKERRNDSPIRKQISAGSTALRFFRKKENPTTDTGPRSRGEGRREEEDREKEERRKNATIALSANN